MIPAALRRRATAIAALGLVVVLYGFARLTAPSRQENAALASRFRFERSPMPAISGFPYKYIRAVQPSLKRIDAWISAVGAGAALADLDGDGLPNDLCHSEPRTDQVIVSPVPGTGDRYAPFTLDAPPGSYKPGTVAPMGCVFADLNEDGRMDILVYYWGRTPVLFLRRTGEPGVPARLSAADFEAVPIGTAGERWFTNAAFAADLDGDGHLDLLICNYFQDGAELLDVAATTRQHLHNTKSHAWNGGRKHLMLWAAASGGEHPSVQFREPEGVFDPRTLNSWTLGAGAADLDGDGLPEIYLANDFGPDWLLHNRSTPGHPRFVALEGRRGLNDPSGFQLGHDSFKGMGIDFADVNGDGIPDMYVSNIADQYALNETHFLWLSTGHPEDMKRGIAPYYNASESLGLARSGWGWDTRLVDFDNDSVLEAIQATGFIKGTTNRWPELQALGTGNDELMENPEHWPSFRLGADVSGHNLDAFFVRDSTGRFQNVNVEIGLTEPMVTRGIAIADVDGDGRMDFAFANQWQDSYFYRNLAPDPGQFLGLHLLLPLQSGGELQVRPGHPNREFWGRPAIGASAVVHLGDTRILAAQVDGGAGHSGKRSPDLHFGLGDWQRDRELKVDLRWRDPGGELRRQTVELTPGWHTVVLGWPK